VHIGDPSQRHLGTGVELSKYWEKSKYREQKVVVIDENLGISQLLGARARAASRIRQRLRLCALVPSGCHFAFIKQISYNQCERLLVFCLVQGSCRWIWYWLYIPALIKQVESVQSSVFDIFRWTFACTCFTLRLSLLLATHL